LVFGFFYFVGGNIKLSRLRSLATPTAVEHAVEDEEIVPDALLTRRIAVNSD
jgi:hypothetical protein